MDRIEHSGAAPETTLAAPLAQGGSLFTVTDGTGYPSGEEGKFYVTIDRGMAGVEETVLCESRAGETFTVASGGRGASGTADTAHSSGAKVEHTFPAQEADDINLAIRAIETRLDDIDDTLALPVQYRTYARSVASVGDGNLGVIVDSFALYSTVQVCRTDGFGNEIPVTVTAWSPTSGTIIVTGVSVTLAVHVTVIEPLT